MVKRLQILFIAALVPFVLTSCGKKEEHNAVPVKRPKPAQQTSAVENAEAKTDLHELTSTSRERNPFVSHILLLRGSETARKIKGPLECCEVSQFKLLALVVAPGSSSALVQAPDGKRYIVKRGDVLGSRDGKIINIQDRSLTVRESVADEGGKTVSSADTELTLASREEDRRPSR
ncbi:MAG: pilus assembly protein PilP [Deltaproteobacteria bacterium]|nr:pilus assembly protein PilP [Deltaproteobacteria bacterium]